MIDDVYWKIIFASSGNLAVACMQDFDERDYTIAINRRFDSEADAEFAVLALNNIREPMDLLRAVKLLEGQG